MIHSSSENKGTGSSLSFSVCYLVWCVFPCSSGFVQAQMSPQLPDELRLHFAKDISLILSPTSEILHLEVEFLSIYQLDVAPTN